MNETLNDGNKIERKSCGREIIWYYNAVQKV